MNSGIIRGRYVIAEPLGKSRWHVIENGAVVHAAGRIVAVGSAADLMRMHPDLPVLGDDNTVVIPGMVNAHHHVGLTPLQMGTGDLPLELWTVARVKTRDIDIYLDTLYSAFEMIASGVTAVQHIRVSNLGSPEQALNSSRECIRAYQDIGMRVSYALGVRDKNHLHHQMDDALFLDLLPEHLRAGAAGHMARFGVGMEQLFEIFHVLSSDYAEADGVRVQLAPPNLHWLSDRALEAYAEVGARTGTCMHMHLCETASQKEYARQRGGGTAVDYLERFGLLSPSLTIGHGVWLTEGDIEKVVDARVHVCHNCSSNFRLRSGIAPLNQLERAGVNVAIGIDEAGINDDRDMLQEMRMVLNAHRVPGYDPADVPTSGQVLRMATSGGAATTPYGDTIGRLAPGCHADAVLLDWRSLSRPYLDPETQLIDAVVARSKQHSVTAVVIGGETVYKDGVFTRVDREAIFDEIERQLAQPLTAAEIQRRRTATQIYPYVRAFYETYLPTGDHRPFYRFNAAD